MKKIGYVAISKDNSVILGAFGSKAETRRVIREAAKENPEAARLDIGEAWQ